MNNYKLIPEQKTEAFYRLGRFLNQFGEGFFLEDPGLKSINAIHAARIGKLIETIQFNNPWFTPGFVRFSFKAIAGSLEAIHLEKWISGYPSLMKETSKKLSIGVIMAGNIPMVGFHDFICVLMSSHHFLGRLSSKDDKLLPAIADVLISIEPGFKESIRFTDELMKGTDAVIATGSDNSARYFEYYFGGKPHIIRKNRNSAAILTGHETENELKGLADDIFLYFGLGCRSVSKVFIPENYDVIPLLKSFEHYSFLGNHNKYANNYDYQKAVYLVNLIPHLDTGFLLFKEDENLGSPVGCLFYEYYKSEWGLIQQLEANSQKIQCIAGCSDMYPKRVPLGATQKTMLWDYSDNVDTLKFLLNLSEK